MGSFINGTDIDPYQLTEVKDYKEVLWLIRATNMSIWPLDTDNWLRRQQTPVQHKALKSLQANGFRAREAERIIRDIEDAVFGVDSAPDSEANQCDGCARGMALDDGVHVGPDGYDYIGCTAENY